MAMQFKNPANGYVEDVSRAPLWSLLFGFFYFAARGVWTHAAAGAALAIVTGGVSWIIYPFFAQQIMRTHYLRRGWLDVSAPPPVMAEPPVVRAARLPASSPSPSAGHGVDWKWVGCAFVGSMFVFSFLIGSHPAGSARLSEPEPVQTRRAREQSSRVAPVVKCEDRERDENRMIQAATGQDPVLLKRALEQAPTVIASGNGSAAEIAQLTELTDRWQSTLNEWRDQHPCL